MVPHFSSELLHQQAVLLVSNQGLLLERKEQRQNGLCRSLQCVLVPRVRARAPNPVVWEAEVQRHEVWVDYEEVGKVLLYGAYNLVVVGFGEAL